MNLTVGDVVQATGATVTRLTAASSAMTRALSVADLQRELRAVDLDSRAVAEGSLFVALRGERTDGHAYVGAALRAGALACLVSDPLDAVDLAPFGDVAYLLSVPDTLTGLQHLAAYQRSRFQETVIGVTGSIGKTTAKEIIASVLSFVGPVLRNPGNLNTEIGLPLILTGLERRHRVAVLEMGMYAPGDIALLARIARPTIGVVTNVAPIHLERLGTIERIARAKSELVAALPADGLAVLNGDDPWTRAMALTSGIAPAILVGFGADCQYRAGALVDHGIDGLEFTLHAEGQSVRLETRVPGRHVVHAFLAAAALARRTGMHWPEIQRAIAEARLDVRQRVLRDHPGMLIIDDSYNAAPMSMSAALSLLRSCPGTRIAVLGDMLELGPGEESAHRDLGERAAGVIDWLVVRGSRAQWIADAAQQSGLPATRIRRASSNVDAARAVLDIVAGSIPAGVAHGPTMRSGPSLHGAADAVSWSVLVKGSRGMGMEEIVERLRGEA
jgi:UDP-N-acetylmuramoyl-tripeptide--D-alanyl-D-alanine ligase